MRINIITDSLDLLAGIEKLELKEQKTTLQNIIDTLGNYPKPKKKQKNVKYIACYLFVSNVRNACKLSVFGFLDMYIGFNVVQFNLEGALSLLVDEF
ncbi:hypothetical protein [Tenacibaculum insulae]|uniref:hypothetical protein n=1 Tax=Tenacibaculum insulae TaxID=2029677 RepID=UPI003AB7FE2B